MKHFLFILAFLTITFLTPEALGKSKGIPDWFLSNLKNQIGVWITNNETYKSKDEPYNRYKLVWKWGVDKTSMTGQLYGIIDDKGPIKLWEYIQYWDSEKKEAIAFQAGYNGLTGVGKLLPTINNEITVIQKFNSPSGKSFEEKHIVRLRDNIKKTISFYRDENGNWKKNRSYEWVKKVTDENISSKIDTLPSGELMLTQSIIINASVDNLWKAYTTAEGWKKWVTPVVDIDFRINGTIKSNYDSTSKIGDKGTIVNHILNYIPYKQITMQAELEENFPQFMKGEEKNLYSIVYFEKLRKNKTKLIVYGIGYKNEKQWRDLLKFFIQANEMTLNKLKTILEQT